MKSKGKKKSQNTEVFLFLCQEGRENVWEIQPSICEWTPW